jgi:hypothetical protein
VLTFPYVVIEDSEVLRRGRNKSHVLTNLVQFSVVLRLSCVCSFECMNLQPRPWIQCKIPALRHAWRSENKPEFRSEGDRTRSSMWMVFFALLCVGKRSEPIEPQKADDALLLKVIPYYLERLDGVCVLFAVSRREDSKHRSLIQNWTRGVSQWEFAEFVADVPNEIYECIRSNE